MKKHIRQLLIVALLAVVGGVATDASAQSDTSVPIYRFWSATQNAHFYTRSDVERDSVIANYDDGTWLYEGIAFYAYRLPATNRSPVYRFWSYSYQSHFYTIVEAERFNTSQNHNWRYENIAWYGHPTSVAGSTPMYRFWSDTYKSHFYTTSAVERNSLINNSSDIWTYEGVVYHVPSI